MISIPSNCRDGSGHECADGRVEGQPERAEFRLVGQRFGRAEGGSDRWTGTGPDRVLSGVADDGAEPAHLPAVELFRVAGPFAEAAPPADHFREPEHDELHERGDHPGESPDDLYGGAAAVV